MPYYINPDGTVHMCDVDVKSDGRIRPIGLDTEIKAKDTKKSGVVYSNQNYTPSRKKKNKKKKNNDQATQIEVKPDITPNSSSDSSPIIESKTIAVSTTRKENKNTVAVDEMSHMMSDAMLMLSTQVWKKNNSNKEVNIPKKYRSMISWYVCQVDGLSKNAYDFIVGYLITLKMIDINKLTSEIIKHHLIEEKGKLIAIAKMANRRILEYKNPRTNSYNSNKHHKQAINNNVNSNSISNLISDSSIKNLKQLKSSLDNIADNHVIKPGNKSKYGYARDFFGRVKKSDIYQEGANVNPYSSTPLYDREDDHDSQDITD